MIFRDQKQSTTSKSNVHESCHGVSKPMYIIWDADNNILTAHWRVLITAFDWGAKVRQIAQKVGQYRQGGGGVINQT